MAEMEEWWDTTKLCNIFNIDNACSTQVILGGEISRNRPFTGGMTGQRHSEETKEKMRQSSLGQRNRSVFVGGKIAKDGKVVEFECISEVCRNLNLSTSHICELLKGKRRSVKGWQKA